MGDAASQPADGFETSFVSMAGGSSVLLQGPVIAQQDIDDIRQLRGLDRLAQPHIARLEGEKRSTG